MAYPSDLRVLRRSVHPDRAIQKFRNIAVLCAFCLAAHALVALAILNAFRGWSL